MSNTRDIRRQVESYCSQIGADPLLVQGAGGNVSWKDGNRFWIKASGTRLADAGRDDIFVPLDLDHLLLAIRKDDFSVKPLVLDKVQMRPSIETLLHALMPQNVVVHLHAVEILAHLVRDDFEQTFTDKLAPDIAWASVPYCKPGAELAQAVSEALRRRPDADVVFLQNHGVVVGGSDIGAVEQLLSRLVASLATPVQRQSTTPANSCVLRTYAEAGYCAIADDDIQLLAQNPQMFSKLPEVWALYPDHVVFLGPVPNCYPDSNALLGDTRRPEFAFVQGDGVYATEAFNKAKQEQLRCYFDVLARQQEATHLKALSDDQVAELIDWDAEKYRLQIAR